MIRDYLPTFHQVEPALLKGLYAGAIIAQRPVKHSSGTYGVDTVTFGTTKFIENGILCGLDKDGYVVNWDDGMTKEVALHFTDELPEILEAKNTFAVKANGDETYLRLVILTMGDEFITDKFKVDGAAAPKYARIVDGVITLQDAFDKDNEAVPNTLAGSTRFKVEAAYLPDGTAGYNCIFLG